LYYSRTLDKDPVPDPLDLPDELRMTLRGREAEAADPNYQEPFQLYTGQDGQYYKVTLLSQKQILLLAINSP